MRINIKTVRLTGSTLLISLLLGLSACDSSQVSQFKQYWIGGVNALDAFSTAIQSNPNISPSLKSQLNTLVARLDPTKPVVQALTTFPPANRQELANLLKELLPVLQTLAGNSQIGAVASIAAAAALTFFQTESDMLSQTGPPPGAAGAPIDPSLRLPELKAKLAELKAAVKDLR